MLLNQDMETAKNPMPPLDIHVMVNVINSAL